MSKGDIFTYTATGDTLSDIEYKSGKQADAFVASFDEGSGDISLYTYKLGNDTGWRAAGNNSLGAATDASTADAFTKVDSKNTVILFVDSDAGKGGDWLHHVRHRPGSYLRLRLLEQRASCRL